MTKTLERIARQPGFTACAHSHRGCSWYVDFIAKADQADQLTQRERITLGLLAQHEALTARELAAALELSGIDALQPWLSRLLDWNLVHSAGRTQSTRYFVAPELLRSLQFPAGTTLKRIEPHRLAALILEDLRRYWAAP